MKYLILIFILFGCESNNLEIINFLPNKTLKHNKLIFKSDTIKSFIETMEHKNNCVLFYRQYPEIITSEYKTGKKIIIPPSKFNYKICLKSNKLYFSDNIDSIEHIILSEDSWFLGDVQCKINTMKKQLVLNKEVETIKVTCDNGEYSIFAKDIGLIESGNKNFTYSSKIKLMDIQN